MPRRKRRIVPGLPHHAITRGNNRRRLFSYDRERRSLLWYVARALDKTNVRLHAVCLLDNHVHLLPTPPVSEALPSFMKSFSHRYAQVRNDQRDGSGKLFEQSYWSDVVEGDTQLAYTTMYIEANPLEVGLVTDAADYPWSTHALHLARPKRSEIRASIWTPSPWYLALGKSWEERADRYAELFAWYVENKVEPAHAEAARRFERRGETYTRRLRRPNGKRASERRRPWPFPDRS